MFKDRQWHSKAAGLYIMFVVCSVTGCSQQPVSVDSPAEVPSPSVKHIADDVTSAAEDRGNVARVETSFRFREIGAESGFDFQRYDDMQG